MAFPTRVSHRYQKSCTVRTRCIYVIGNVSVEDAIPKVVESFGRVFSKNVKELSVVDSRLDREIDEMVIKGK